VGFVAGAFRLRGIGTTVASECDVDRAAGLAPALRFGLPPSIVLTLPSVEPRRGLSGVLLPLNFSREAIPR